MAYVGGGAQEEGCIFCKRLRADDDVRSLIVHRDRDAFVIMNLFPYNTGHVMLVPNAHVASPEEADDDALRAVSALRRPTLRALRRALGCDGFNLGLNVGAVAGAGVAAHMHEHVVPRWTGDANFMPILASTMVMPELIPITYAKLRAELRRECTQAPPEAVLVILDGDAGHVLVDAATGRLPRMALVENETVWRRALEATAALGITTTLIDWAGEPRAESTSSIAVTLRAEAGAKPIAGMTWVAVDDEDRMANADRPFMRRAP